MLVVRGVTMHGTAADLRRLLAAIRSAGGSRWVLLCQELAEGLQEHESDSESASDESDVRHGR